jgi:hypothetical protein
MNDNQARVIAEHLIDAAEHEMLATDDPGELERLKAERAEHKASLELAEQRLGERRRGEWIKRTSAELRLWGRPVMSCGGIWRLGRRPGWSSGWAKRSIWNCRGA